MASAQISTSCSLNKNKAGCLSIEVFEDVLEKVLNIFQLKALKPDQKESIRLLAVERRDVLAVLPTGYGKSIIYQVLPKIYEEGYKMLHAGDDKKFSVIVVSPLEYIRIQQVSKLNSLGIKSVCLEEIAELYMAISNGQYEVIFGSAEQWFSSKWKKVLQEEKLTNIQALVVDEVHTVELW